MEQIALVRKSQPESQIPGKNNIPAWGWIGNVFAAWGNDRPSHPPVRKFAGMDREPPKPPFSDFADVPRDSPFFSQPPKPPKPPKGNGSPIFASRQTAKTAKTVVPQRTLVLARRRCWRLPAARLTYSMFAIVPIGMLHYASPYGRYLQVTVESRFRLTMVFRRSA